MTKATRYVQFEHRLAAALSSLLPEDVRDDLRARKAPAKAVISLFQLDHVRFHTWADADDPDVNAWHNLTWLPTSVHKEKTRVDQGKIAKVRRLKTKRDREIAAGEAQEAVRRLLFGGHPAREPRTKMRKKMNGDVVSADGQILKSRGTRR